MRKISLIVIFSLLLFLAVHGCGEGPGGKGYVNGTVLKYNPLNSTFSPFSSAFVFDRTDNLSARSLSDGTYSYLAASGGEHVLVFSSPGYTKTYRKPTIAGAQSYVDPAILSPLDGKITSVGPSGGTATNTTASIKLSIPASALSSDVDVSLTHVNLVAAPFEPPLDEYFISVITYISSPDVTLSSDATLSIPNLTGLPVGFTNINFYHFNPVTVSWESFTATADPQVKDTNEIEAKILKFGWIAATLPIAPQAGSVSGVIRDQSNGNPIEYASVWSSGHFTVADRYGRYELTNMPTGEAVVEASATNYANGSGLVTIEAGLESDLDIYLTPLDSGNVFGKVRNSAGGAPIAGARVVYSYDKQTLTDDYGNYSLYDVPPGLVTVSAYSTGFYSNSNYGQLPTGGQVNIDIYMTSSGGIPVAWTNAMETTETWSISSNVPEVTWQIVDVADSLVNTFESFGIVDFPDVMGSPYEAYLPPPKEGTRYMWFGEADIGSYSGPLLNVTSAGGTSDNVRLRGYLTSEAIDTRDWAYATFTLWTWWEIEGVNPGQSSPTATFDEMLILVTKDGGGTWYDVAKLNPLDDPDKDISDEKVPYSSAGHNKTGVWVKHVFDLTPYVGNYINLLFRYDTRDRKYNGFRGWCIDDVTISPEQYGMFGLSKARTPVQIHTESPVVERR